MMSTGSPCIPIIVKINYDYSVTIDINKIARIHIDSNISYLGSFVGIEPECPQCKTV